MKNELITFTACAFALSVGLFALGTTLELQFVQDAVLNSQEKILQAKVEECNNIKSSLNTEILRKGPPVVRQLLGLSTNADNFDIANLVSKRSLGSLTARQEALAVLQMPWYTPEPILRNRLKVIDSTLIAMNSQDPRIGSSCGGSGITLFKWFPHN